MKGRIAALPCVRAFAIEADVFLWVGMSPAMWQTGLCYQRDDLKAEESSVVASGGKCRIVRPGFQQGDLPGAQALGPRPACCPMEALIGHELLQADRYVSGLPAFAVLIRKCDIITSND
jgi:hypothetical protein